MSTRDSDVEVDFTVSVPAGVDFVGSTIAGNVFADGLSSDAFAETIAGDVRISTSQLAEAQVVSGSITATIGLPTWDRDLEFLAVTGDVSLTLPAATNAVVEASVATGTVTSDFGLTETEPGTWTGTLGSGGRRLTIAVVTGNITLNRGS